MKKIVRKLLLTGLVVAVVGYIALDLFLGRVVTAGVNKLGPSIMQTSVRLEGADISPLTGSGTLSGLVVGNPKGWSSANALSVGKTHVKLSPFSVFGDHIVVKEIIIDDATVTYETKVVSSNLSDLVKNIGGSAGNAGSTSTSSGKPIRFEVLKFRLTNAHVSLGVGPTAITLPMPPISLDNLGTAEGGISADQLATAVMRSVATNVASASAQAAAHLGSTLGAAAGNAAGSAADQVMGLFGAKKK